MKNRTLLSALTLTVACALLFAGCDGSGPETPPTPSFEATLSGAMNGQLEGTAALGADFGPGTFFTFQLPPTFPLSGRTITAIQLRDTEEAVTHGISLIYVGEDRPAPGTYDVGSDLLDPSIFEECRDAENPPACVRDALGPSFFASYTRRTADSVYRYPIGSTVMFSEGQPTPITSGEITIETVSEDLIEGSFHLEASSVMIVALEELEEFREAMRGWNGDPEDLPPLPDFNHRPLTPPLVIDGAFTAAPADLPPLRP